MTSATPNITTNSLDGNMQQVSRPAPNAARHTTSTPQPRLYRRRIVIPRLSPASIDRVCRCGSRGVNLLNGI